MNITELREGLAYVEAQLADLHAGAAERAFTPEEQARWDEGKTYVTDTRAAIKAYEDRAAVIAERAAAGSADAGDAGARNVPNFNRNRDDAASLAEDRAATPRQMADGLIRAVAERGLPDEQIRKVLQRHLLKTEIDDRRGDIGRAWARDLLIRATPVYERAVLKYMTGREVTLTNEERAAISATTDANGGYLVPTHLDPTIILTNDGSANALRPISRVVTTIGNANVWNGVTSAGVTASFDAPATEVSDDSPTFGQPSITVHKAQALVQATIEAFDDIAGLASDVVMLFADAKDVLEGEMHATGSGTNQPVGIFTALDANTNVEITSTTAATIGLVDLQAVRRGVPQRWRGRGTWVMNPTWADEIKRLGTAVSASYSTDITQSNTDLLLGRPLVETDDAPEVTTTTALDNRIVFGDFQNYVIVDKPGSTSIEFVPHLFNTSNNLPDGRRAWYMHWRSGADSVNDVAFRLLQDKTSA